MRLGDGIPKQRDGRTVAVTLTHQAIACVPDEVPDALARLDEILSRHLLDHGLVGYEPSYKISYDYRRFEVYASILAFKRPAWLT